LSGARGLRVLYLLHRYPQLSQTFVRNEIGALRRAGVQVDVMTVEEGDVASVLPGWAGPISTFPRTGYGARQGVTALARWSARHPRRVARMVAHRSPDAEYRVLGFRRLPALAAGLRRGHYDRVHTHFAWPSADLARQLADLLDIPASVTVHARDIFDRPIGELAVLEAMDDVVTVCRFNVDYLRAAGLRNPRLHVVPCGVEIPDEIGTPVAGASGSSGCDVLAVGRLVPKKGFDTLVEAVAAIAPSSPGLSVRIIGDGPERERLGKQINERGLGAVIRLTGPADHASTLAAIAGAKVFCLPARRAADGDMDALPVVLREAQARAVPVVSTTVAGIPEVVDAESGWLVPPADPMALAGALQQALSDPTGRRLRGERGRERVSATGTLEVQARELMEIFGGAGAGTADGVPVAVPERLPLAGRR
jgi:colanic acid/amylovoran biosynthesis glycosyltransferase